MRNEDKRELKDLLKKQNNEIQLYLHMIFSLPLFDDEFGEIDEIVNKLTLLQSIHSEIIEELDCGMKMRWKYER